jgi:hypothetical protein
MDSWRNHLTKDEAAEITAIESERENIKEAQRSNRKRHNDILWRATMRMRRLNRGIEQ